LLIVMKVDLLIQSSSSTHPRVIAFSIQASMKRIPVVGPPLQHFMMCFLERKWAKDAVHMTRLLHNYIHRRALKPLLILLFPGTN
jgi:hypothetical protein